MTNNRNGNEKQ